MAVTTSDIRGWLKRGKEEGATHMMVVCDTYDNEDYPVMVMPDEKAEEKRVEFDKNMQQVMEIYNLSMDFEEQLKEGTRVWNY